MSKNWFTSDTHFGHENIIRYSNRPYKDKYEMDESVIVNWNSKVQPGDNVFHGGDIFFCKKERAIQILSRLNGNITLIAGNHDKAILRDVDFIKRFHKVVEYLELSIEGQKIVISHYPMMTWNGSSRGAWMLHGHCHGNLKYPFEAKLHDIGIDPNNYFPLSFEDLKRILDKKNISVIDHHGAKE